MPGELLVLTGFSYFGEMNNLSLVELNSIIKNILAENLEPSYWVIAEIGEMRINQKGHCYLELIEKEDDIVLAKAKATIWSYTYRNLSAWFESMTRQSIRTGLKLLMNVQVQFHEVYGFSLNVRDIDPTFTLGEKEKKKQEILKRLESEGIIFMNKELRRPVVPQRIAVISSPTAAGYEDFIHQLENNEAQFKIQVRLFKAIMQGQEAITSIPKAIRLAYEFHEEFDMLVIIRGGGSQVDLDCYDSYDICSLIAQFPLPVLTGIGHERDETLADVVAHTRVKTPTAAAEFILNGFYEFDENILRYSKMILEVVANRLEDESNRISEFVKYLTTVSKSNIQFNKTKLDLLGEKLTKEPIKFISNRKVSLSSYDTRLRILDPVNVLKRGFTISMIDNKLVKNIKKIKTGQSLHTITENRQIVSIVDKIEKNAQKD